MGKGHRALKSSRDKARAWKWLVPKHLNELLFAFLEGREETQFRHNTAKLLPDGVSKGNPQRRRMDWATEPVAKLRGDAIIGLLISAGRTANLAATSLQHWPWRRARAVKAVLLTDTKTVESEKFPS